MKKHIIVGKNTKRGYTLLVRLDTTGVPVNCQPFVVAWCYNEESDDWLAGHYFDSIEAAVAFLHS